MEEEKIKSRAKLVEVPTQFGVGIQLEDGSVVNETELLLRIYNIVQDIKKGLA